MVVVLIIGILISIAVPVFLSATADAQDKGCMANQRTIKGAVDMYSSVLGTAASSVPGVLETGGTGWSAILLPDWIKNGPACPKDRATYYLGANGDVLGDNGSTPAFKPGHRAP